LRYAVLSDVHSNLEALEVVLSEIDRLGIDQIVCLGDLVGYNANPNECVQVFSDRGIPTLMGNHDAAGCGLEEPIEFNPIARDAILWTREALEPKHREFLHELPEQRNLGEQLRLVHGSLVHRDHYLSSHFDIMENIRRMKKVEPEIRILFFGHTHIQVAFACEQDNLTVVSSPRFSIREDTLYLINPGSVGQPRDQDPRCAFLVYDEDAQTVEFIRLSYDIHACRDKIFSAGLPRELADRLHVGC
jgi:predicted phosphodiesterase